MRNETRRTLEADEPALGAWTLSMSPRAAEALAATEMDWVGIDTEHTPVDGETVEGMIRGVERGGATPIVRLPSVGSAVGGAAKHALDSGAGGIIVPGVESPEAAERAVRAARFPPRGDRGVAGTTRANEYGTAFDEYVREAHRETLVIVQIESATAVDRVESILGVEGIDVAFVGENDLSSTYGHPGEKDHPEVRAAVEEVLATARANDVIPGIGGRTPENLLERIDRGFRFFLLGADLSFMREGVAPFLAQKD